MRLARVFTYSPARRALYRLVGTRLGRTGLRVLARRVPKRTLVKVFWRLLRS